MRRLLLLLALGVCLLACGLATPTPTPTVNRPAAPTGAAPPISTAPLAGVVIPPRTARFASWSLPGAAQLPPQPPPAADQLPSLAELANPGDLFPLDEPQRALLEATGFVVLPTPYPSLEAIYAAAAADRRPVLITADLLLSTSAAAIAATWAQVAPQLTADLEALLTTLQPVAVAQWQAAEGDPLLTEAAQAQAAYLSVAAALLGLDLPAPPAIARLVADELTLVRQAAGVFRSPVQGYETDYAPFAGQPETIQTLLWLSRLAFRLDGPPALVRRQARQVLLLLTALEMSDNRSRWERLDVALGYFWGEPAGLTMADVDVIVRAVYGTTPPPGGVPGQLDQFIATARQFGAVVRFLPYSGEQQAPLSDVAEALTFNRVGVLTNDDGVMPSTALATDIGLVRVVAHPLDGAAALGSDRALALLQAAGETRYDGYEAQLATVQASLEARDEAAWTRTIPDAWTYATRGLLAEAPASAPVYMQSEAWRDRQLWAWLGAQLLPALGEGAPAGGTFAGAAVAVVEPQPELYTRLAALFGQLRRGVAARGLADEPVAVRLALWEEALVLLARISVKQPAGIGLTAEETALLTVLGQRLAAATAPQQRGTLGAPGTVLLDRDTAAGRASYGVLVEALPLYALVTAGEEKLVAVGAIWSTTTLVRPAAAPFTGTIWQELPAAEQGERPLWTNRFVAPAGN